MATNLVLCSLLSIYYYISIVHGQTCQWTVQDPTSGTSKTLDLSCIAGKVLSFGHSEYAYRFSPCANAVACGNAHYMASQTTADGMTCFNLAVFDPSIGPVYTNDGGDEWTFTYQNGQTDCDRVWKPRFICDPTEEAAISFGEENPVCTYLVFITTKYACADQAAHCEIAGEEDEGLSGGWIFIIILIVVFFLYCVIGYVVMALTVNKNNGFKDFSGNIPQKAFWLKLPALVFAGCVYSKEFVQGMINKRKGDKSETLKDNDAIDSYE